MVKQAEPLATACYTGNKKPKPYTVVIDQLEYSIQ